MSEEVADERLQTDSKILASLNHLRTSSHSRHLTISIRLDIPPQKRKSRCYTRTVQFLNKSAYFNPHVLLFAVRLYQQTFIVSVAHSFHTIAHCSRSNVSLVVVSIPQMTERSLKL